MRTLQQQLSLMSIKGGMLLPVLPGKLQQDVNEINFKTTQRSNNV